MRLLQLRETVYFKGIAVFVALNLLVEIILPNVAFALTSGPSVPEVQSFEPVGTTDMVDLFTGDFTYNIPLFELPGPNGGYPFNLAYHSGISMDQEASWVGLGWNLTPGAINRTMRGMPDDFKGDEISRTTDFKPNITVGAGLGSNIEIWGFDQSKNSNGTLSAQIKVYYNNYKGVGYSLSPSVAVPASTIAGGGKLEGVGFGASLSLDSQDGVGGNVSVSYTKNNTKYASGVGFNSRRGLDVSMSVSRSNKKEVVIKDKDGEVKGVIGKGELSMGGGSTFSFAERGYTPATTLPMRSSFLTTTIKTGGDLGGVFTNLSILGYYNEQHLKNRGVAQDHSAYGYNFLEAAGASDMLDFNRSKDGALRQESPNLAIPQLTYDYYNVMGQGIGGMYRAYRNDIGVLHDPEEQSTSFGGAIGTELGPGAPFHTGVDGSFSHSRSISKKWEIDDNTTDPNDWDEYYAFRDETADASPLHEKLYYKAHGEMTSFATTEMDFIGGEQAVRAELEENDPIRKPVDRTLHGKDGTVYGPSTVDNLRRTSARGRMPRNTSIQPIANQDMGEITDGNNNTVAAIGEYQVYYYDQPDGSMEPYTGTANAVLDRSARPSHHIGGITSVNTDGARYVYGLPCYNEEDRTYTFSVDDAQAPNSCSNTIPVPVAQSGQGLEGINYTHNHTNNFFDVTKMPAYAYSYLLTSILGADYVDVNGNGPDDADLGYWVKFNYAKTSVGAGYQWRAPFTDASFNRGLNSTKKDDQGTFKYGTKEVYHLASAETKTHIAVFHVSERSDGRGAASALNNSSGNTIDANSKAYKLDRIGLYEKANYRSGANERIPIKEVYFDYFTEGLCPGIDNSTSLNGVEGKLTLKTVHFTYQNNNRGSLSPYQFTYTDFDENTTGFQPGYDTKFYDRWGNYKQQNVVADCDYLENPYVEQFNVNNTQDATERDNFQTKRNQQIAAWHLESIELPTGGKIMVDYEADDYAYVQHKKAQQMFQIERLGFNDDDQIYAKNPVVNQDPDRKVYFKLETPIVKVPGDEDVEELRRTYLGGLRSVGDKKQVYYKINVDLRDGFSEYVSGYATIDEGNTNFDDTSEQMLDVDGDGSLENCYTKAYITLDKMDINGPVDYHPFAVAAWQHMRTNQPDLLTSNVLLDEGPSSKAERRKKIKGLAGMIPELIKMFRGYRKYAANRGYASKLNLGQSFIRLCSPDGKKFGGNQRVKEIIISDQWNALTGTGENTSTYGQVYEYTMEENGRTISSGVAQYEPMIGGDENALRYAKTYPRNIPLQTDNSLFFEYPINESYFPAPVVGYRKVTVKSLATQAVIEGNNGNNVNNTPVTGITENEFYTAKDYPIITEETDLDNGKDAPYSLYVPIPGIGQVVTNNYSGSQGYAIKMNDMHGKQKAVKNYGLSKTGQRVPEPVSSVSYHYQHKERTYDGEMVRELDNVVTTISTEIPLLSTNTSIPTEQRIMGVEYEFFTDMRHHRSVSNQGGLQFNAEVAFLPLGIPWPTYARNTNNVTTVVTNKIVHKAGILKQVVATDGQSTVTTDNLLHDDQTGRVLLSSVNNNFDQPVYNYSIPAHWKYDRGMGAAYKNYGLELAITLQPGIGGNLHYVNSISPSLAIDYLVPGDEFIANEVLKATYLGSDCNNIHLFYFDEAFFSVPGTGFIDLKLYRSGRRNQLTTDASSLVALSNPTENMNSDVFLKSAKHYNCGCVLSPTGYQCTANPRAVFKVNNVLQISATEMDEGLVEEPITSNSTSSELLGHGKPLIANGYITGERGVWRPKKTHNYFEDRLTSYDYTVTTQPNEPNLATDGIFYNDQSTNGEETYAFLYDFRYSSQAAQWKTTNTITRYNAAGFEVENQDILGIYSSAKYDVAQNLPVVVARNAQHKETYFDSNEEDVNPASPPAAHTGNVVALASTTPVVVDMDPVAGKEYIFSAWINWPNSPKKFTYKVDPVTSNNTACGINLYYQVDGTIQETVFMEPVGEVIEGWQKVEGRINIPTPLAGTIEIGYESVIPSVSGSTEQLFIDDLRIFPDQGNITTYVYDPATFKLSAVLGENNYATYYHYDSEGSLFLVEKETLEGRKTIQESRNHQVEQ